MNVITLYKRYSDGEVRSLDVNDTSDNVRHMLRHGFFLSEEEATTGKVSAPAPAEKVVGKRPVKKAAAKK